MRTRRCAAALLKFFRGSTEGTAIVEAALVIPVVIILMAGVTDFGRAYYTLATAQKSTRSAVRYLTSLPPGSICGWGLTRAKNLARYGNIDGTGNLLVANWTAAQITLTSPDCSSPVTSASIIKINADVPFSPVMWPAVGLPSSMTLKIDYQARWIGE